MKNADVQGMSASEGPAQNHQLPTPLSSRYPIGHFRNGDEEYLKGPRPESTELGGMRLRYDLYS